jgi:hypothetical protein
MFSQKIPRHEAQKMMIWWRRIEFWLFGDRPDPTWPRQTPIQRFAGYDADLARRGYERSRAASSSAPAADLEAREGDR